MDIITKGSRIKYYRELLGMTQKELAGNCFSVYLIKSIEANKRGITVSTAAIILKHFLDAAERKGIPLNIQLDELLMSDVDYARYFCSKKLNDNDEFDLSNYELIISIAKEYSLSNILMNVYEKMIIHYYIDKKYADAAVYLKNQYELSICLEDYHQQVNSLSRIGTCYYLVGDFKNSITYYSKSYDIYKNNIIENTSLLMKVLHNLALNYAALKMFNEALVYVDMLLETKNMDENQLTKILTLKSSILIDLQRYEEALLICEDLIARNFENIYIVQHNIGFILSKLNKLDDSIRYYTESINNQLKSPDSNTTLSLIGIADVYKKEGNLKTSRFFYEYAIKNAIDYNQPDEMVSGILSLYDIYSCELKLDLFFIYANKLLSQYKNQTVDNILFGRLEILIKSLVK